MEAPSTPGDRDAVDGSPTHYGQGGYSATLVRDQNAALQMIPLSASRLAELPTELNQFFAATQSNRARLDFDVEPAGFAAALARHGGGGA